MVQFCQVEGYAVWMRYALYDSAKKFVKWSWVERTDRRATIDLEFAQALTHDLQKMGVAWEIRNKKGEVVESWSPEVNS